MFSLVISSTLCQERNRVSIINQEVGQVDNAFTIERVSLGLMADLVKLSKAFLMGNHFSQISCLMFSVLKNKKGLFYKKFISKKS